MVISNQTSKAASALTQYSKVNATQVNPVPKNAPQQQDVNQKKSAGDPAVQLSLSTQTTASQLTGQSQNLAKPITQVQNNGPQIADTAKKDQVATDSRITNRRTDRPNSAHSLQKPNTEPVPLSDNTVKQAMEAYKKIAMSQAPTTLQAQANSTPQNVLDLLK